MTSGNELSEDARKVAKEQLNEDDETREKALAEIRRWIEENPQLHVNDSTFNLLAFLRVCKFNIAKCKLKMTNFYAMKRDRVEWFANRDPQLPELRDLAKLGVFLPLKSTCNNKTVILIRPTAFDPKTHEINNMLKVSKMILDVACSKSELIQIYGVVALVDMKNVGLALARQLSVSVIRNAVYAWHNYHCRPQKMVFFNAPYLMNVILNTFRRFMSEKMKKRIKVMFKGLDPLEDLPNLNLILPPEYDGQGDSIQELGNFWYNELVQAADWFKEDEKFKAE